METKRRYTTSFGVSYIHVQSCYLSRMSSFQYLPQNGVNFAFRDMISVIYTATVDTLRKLGQDRLHEQFQGRTF